MTRSSVPSTKYIYEAEIVKKRVPSAEDIYEA